jgi:CheY-like chemotaxis protein
MPVPNPPEPEPKPTPEPNQPSQFLFLIIDDNPEGRFFLSKTLSRKFPGSTVIECAEAGEAFRRLETIKPHLVVCHRTFEFDGYRLVKELRKRMPKVPILMTSGMDRHEDALRAGANDFLTYDQWLLLGTRVANLLNVRPASESAAPL